MGLTAELKFNAIVAYGNSTTVLSQQKQEIVLTVFDTEKISIIKLGTVLEISRLGGYEWQRLTLASDKSVVYNNIIPPCLWFSQGVQQYDMSLEGRAYYSNDFSQIKTMDNWTLKGTADSIFVTFVGEYDANGNLVLGTISSITSDFSEPIVKDQEGSTIFSTGLYGNWSVNNPDEYAAVYNNWEFTAASEEPDTTPTFDKKAFRSGLAMGLCGKGNPVGNFSDRLSYNGMVLPSIDTILTDEANAEYQYAYIGIAASKYYMLVITKDSVTVSANKTNLFLRSARRYLLRNEKWEEYNYVDKVPKIAWSNTDVYYGDTVETIGGTLCLAASEPIADAFSKGYSVGAELRVKRVLPVAYLYNGVQLPPLPEWDKKTYPYALIEYYGENSSNGPTANLFVFDIPAGYNRYQLSDTVTASCIGASAGETMTRMKATLISGGEAVSNPTFGNATASERTNISGTDVLWSNYDVADNINGGTLKAASDPVPVYE